MRMIKHELSAHLDRLVTQQKQYLTDVLRLMNQACESEQERESFYRILSGRMYEELNDDELSVFDSISNTEVIDTSESEEETANIANPPTENDKSE